MEGLLNQRFNFFIIIFGFIVAAIPYVKNVPQLKLILVAGFIIELVFTLLIGRAQRRLKINLDMMDGIKDDPSTAIKNIANKGFFLNPFKYSVVRLMGYYMPIAITLILFLSIFWACDIYNFFK
jgi:disulfide bond formation protein DsbB